MVIPRMSTTTIRKMGRSADGTASNHRVVGLADLHIDRPPDGGSSTFARCFRPIRWRSSAGAAMGMTSRASSDAKAARAERRLLSNIPSASQPASAERYPVLASQHGRGNEKKAGQPRMLTRQLRKREQRFRPLCSWGKSSVDNHLRVAAFSLDHPLLARAPGPGRKAGRLPPTQ
jgi:hypothetical protein